MINLRTILLFLILSCQVSFGQKPDSSKISNDSTVTKIKTYNKIFGFDSTGVALKLKSFRYYRKPTMPKLGISEKQKKFYIGVSNKDYLPTEQRVNWDALNKPTTDADLEITRDYILSNYVLLSYIY